MFLCLSLVVIRNENAFFVISTEFAKPGDKKDEAVNEEAKPVGFLKEDK